MKRAGVAGSTAGTLILAMMLFRGGAPTPAPRPETATTQDHLASSRQGQAQPSTAQEKKKKWPEDGPWKASRQHFAGLQAEGECPSLNPEPKTQDVASLSGVTLSMRQSGKGRNVGDPHRDVWCIPQGVPVRAMIAIVPDPVHSHLSLIFDRSVEALQLSAESTGYVVDRYWLPWQPETPGSYAPTQAEVQDAGEKEEQPGLLLFRWNGAVTAPNPKVLYVFLVSDTSTAGVNGTQFRNAVEYVQQVHGAAAQDRIWIMGPTFSGSLASLRALTSSWPKLNFTAYSGTVSSICAIQNQSLLDSSLRLDELSPACVDRHETRAGLPTRTLPPAQFPDNLSFRSLVSDSETVVRKFLEMLESNHDIECDDDPDHHAEVAILSEAATTYGGAGSSLSAPSGASGVSVGEKKQPCNYTSFRYPREISSLRNASASSEPPAAASPQAGPIAVPTYLPFNLADRQPNSSDEPPDFSRVQGPLSKEAVLMKYAAELRRGHYKYAGIIGTNVVDVLFLAGFLRKACPDVRLFMLNSDLLFERDQDNAPYIGMLSLSTYPSLGRNLAWINPTQLQHLPFADEYQEGLYNAAYLIMQELVPVAPVAPEPPPFEISEPFLKPPEHFNIRSDVLPVWITAVGTGGYWPVRIIPFEPASTNRATAAGTAKLAGVAASAVGARAIADGAASAALRPRLDGHDFSPAWRTIGLLLEGLAFLQSWILLTVKPWSVRFRDFSLINAAPAQRYFFINVASAAMAFLLAILCTTAWKFGMQADHHVPDIAIAGLIAIVALFISSCYLAFVFRKIRQQECPTEGEWAYRVSVLFSVAVWLLAALGEWSWLALHRDDATHYGFFFGYRAANLATGVSPFTPMLPLLAAILLWAVFEIWRLRFDNHVRPWLSTTDNVPGAVTEAPIARAVNHYLLDTNYFMMFVFLFVGWFLSLGLLHPFQLFEKRSFGLLYEVLFCLVVALMLTSSLRLAQTWTALRRLLRELEWSPIRYAFSRLRLGSWSPIWQSGGQEAEWNNMARSFEVMQLIKNCDEPLEAGLGETISAALAARDEIRKGRRLKPAEDFKSDSPVPDKLLARLWHVLKHAWEKILLSSKEQLSGSAVDKFCRLEKLFADLQCNLAAVLTGSMKVLQHKWDTECWAVAENDEFGKEERPVVVNCCKEKPEAGLEKVRRLEECAALRYVAFIRAVLAHIRHWLILQATVFSLVLISLNIYSFEPHQSLIWSFTAIFVFIGVIAIQVLMQAHKDPVISRITGGQPNELGLQFFLRIATLGAVPLLTLLATHFPSIGHYLLSFFQPGLEALK